MGDLSGTKLWSFEEDKKSAKNAKNIDYLEEKESFKATKIGSPTEFEKSLGLVQEPILEAKETQVAHEILEEEKEAKPKEEKPVSQK